MTDSPEQTAPPPTPDDIVEGDGTVIAVVGDVHLGIDGMGREDDDLEPEPGGEDDDLEPEPGGDGDHLEPEPGGGVNAGEEDPGDA